VGVRGGRAAGAEDETLDAIHDHNDIRDAVIAVAGHQVGTDSWYAAVAAANLANSDHMGEEEREGLTDFRRLASLQLRHDLAVSFIAFEARNYAGVPPVDKDPEEYVREEEQRQGLASNLDAGDGSASPDRPASPDGPATPDGSASPGGSASAGPPDGSLSIGSLKEN
jgi:hypothetical protein